MNNKYINIFVLGAGASVDYGLPVWSELRELLIEYLNKNTASIISPDVSNRFLHELQQIGTDKKYATVDEMISKFPDDDAEILDPTEAIFDVVGKIFKSKVRTESVGWIETFVKKNNLEILLNNEASNTSSVFINFNYDTLLLSKIVQIFRKKYERAPERKMWKKHYGRDYVTEFNNCGTDIFHPHGILYLCDKNEMQIGQKTTCHPTSNTYRNAQTRVGSTDIASKVLGRDNAISCHDTREHFTFSEIKNRITKLARSGQPKVDTRLILLGVGPDSLAFNLNKIFEGQTFDVRQIYYTCTMDDEQYIYEQYFNKFQARIERYANCKELVENNTFIPFN